MITAGATGGPEVVVKLRSLPETMRLRLKREVTRQALDLKDYVVQQKLSGQVLHRITGTLAASINTQVAEEPGGVVGRVGVLGKAVKYAAYHEYGFHGPVSVKAHLRSMTMAWGRPMKNPHEVSVRQHQRELDYAGNPFLRPALEEKRAQIEAGIAGAVREVGA